MHKIHSLIALLSLTIAASADAADKAEAPLPEAPAVQNVIDCRAIADASGRLACFDQKVADLDRALKARQIVVSDREEVIRTRRGLFGFTVPIGRLLGLAGDDEAADVKQLETTVTAVRTSPNGWVLTFADGAVWSQTDVRVFALSPKVGNKALIKRGAVGSYTISVDGQPGIKFIRTR